MPITATTLRSPFARNKLPGHLMKEKYQDPKHKRYMRGWVHVDKSQRVQRLTPGNYLGAGMDVNVMIAIDLTGSNAQQGKNQEEKDRGGLHALDPKGVALNPYQQTLKAVADVLMQYDT